jgi:hypothetical protein
MLEECGFDVDRIGKELTEKRVLSSPLNFDVIIYYNYFASVYSFLLLPPLNIKKLCLQDISYFRSCRLKSSYPVYERKMLYYFSRQYKGILENGL